MSNESQQSFITRLLELIVEQLFQVEQRLGFQEPEQVFRGPEAILASVEQRFADINAELDRRNQERDIEVASARQRSEPEPQAGGSRGGPYHPEVEEFGLLMSQVARGANWDSIRLGISEERYQQLQENSSSLRDFLRAVLVEWYGNLEVVNLGRVGRPGTIVMSHERRHQLYRLAAVYCVASETNTSFVELAKMLAHLLANAKRGPSKSRSPEPKRRRSAKDDGDASSDSDSSGDDGANNDDGNNDDSD